MLIEIPSRGRPQWLLQTLVQLYNVLQTPGLLFTIEGVLIVLSSQDDMDPVAHALFKKFPCSGGVLVMLDPEASLPDKHQAALNCCPADCASVLILHDDLQFDAVFLSRLATALNEPQVGAAAGLYPLALLPVETMPKNYRELPSLAGRLAEAVNYHQVMRYPDTSDEPIRYDVEHLFGPYLYRVSALKQIGGFPVGQFSRVSHREETYVTNQLFRAGYRLAVVKCAEALHFMVPKGGAADDRTAMMPRDEQVFRGK